MDISGVGFSDPEAAAVLEVRATTAPVLPAAPVAARASRVTATALLPLEMTHRSHRYIPVACLTAAKVLRDCSLRPGSSSPERQACRTLMRKAALKWRRGESMGD